MEAGCCYTIYFCFFFSIEKTFMFNIIIVYSAYILCCWYCISKYEKHSMEINMTLLCRTIIFVRNVNSIYEPQVSLNNLSHKSHLFQGTLGYFKGLNSFTLSLTVYDFWLLPDYIAEGKTSLVIIKHPNNELFFLLFLSYISHFNKTPALA